MVEALSARVAQLEDHLEITQLVARYGPSVDSGSADATAALWTDDGVFDAVGAVTMHGHDEIAGMVLGAGHQSLILNGCAHVLTAPHVVVDGDTAEAAATPSTSAGTRSRSGSGSPGCRPTPGTGCAPPRAGGSRSASTPTSTAPPGRGPCSPPTPGRHRPLIDRRQALDCSATLRTWPSPPAKITSL